VNSGYLEKISERSLPISYCRCVLAILSFAKMGQCCIGYKNSRSMTTVSVCRSVPPSPVPDIFGVVEPLH
jgi:hypothetical protein